MLRSQQEELMANRLKESVENRTWVLEANRLQGRRGSVINVSSVLNFVKIEGEVAVIQLGSASGIGANGVGGITFEGRVTKYDCEWNEKNDRFVIDIQMSSSMASFTIRMNVDATGQMAAAEISTNGPGRLSYLGQVVPLSDGNVYKGTSTP